MFTLAKIFLATLERIGGTRVDQEIGLGGCPSVGEVRAMLIGLLVAETELKWMHLRGLWDME